MTDELAQALLEELRGLRGDVQALKREQPHRRRRRARDSDREVLTISEFAARVGKDRVDVRAAMDDGRLRWVPWGPGRRRLSVDELDRVKREGWLETAAPGPRKRRQPRAVVLVGALPGENVGDAILALDEARCTGTQPVRKVTKVS